MPPLKILSRIASITFLALSAYLVAVVVTANDNSSCQFRFGSPLTAEQVAGLGPQDIANKLVSQWLHNQKNLFACPGRRLKDFRIDEVQLNSQKGSDYDFTLRYDYQVDNFPGRWHLTGEGDAPGNNNWELHAWVCSVSMQKTPKGRYQLTGAHICGSG